MEVVISVNAYLFLFLLMMWQMFTLLWATKLLAGFTTNWQRLCGGAFFGVAYAVLVDLANYGLLPGDKLLGEWWLALAVSVLTYLVTFLPVPWGKGLRGLGYYYLLSFLGAGAAYGVQNLFILAGSPPLLVSWSGPVVNVVTMLLVAELGWGVIQNWLWQRVLHLPMEIRLLDREVRLNALLDTGNQLREPLSGAPVVIVGIEGAKKLLPIEIREALAQVTTLGLEQLIQQLEGTAWASRLRIIPFTSLGKEHGLLVGFRTDEIRLFWHRGQPLVLPNVVVGFYHRRLSGDGAYQALIHPELLQDLIGDTLTVPPQVERRISMVLGR